MYLLTYYIIDDTTYYQRLYRRNTTTLYNAITITMTITMTILYSNLYDRLVWEGGPSPLTFTTGARHQSWNMTLASMLMNAMLTLKISLSGLTIWIINNKKQSRQCSWLHYWRSFYAQTSGLMSAMLAPKISQSQSGLDRSRQIHFHCCLCGSLCGH